MKVVLQEHFFNGVASSREIDIHSVNIPYFEMHLLKWHNLLKHSPLQLILN
jgi:hypothetical protein